MMPNNDLRYRSNLVLTINRYHVKYSWTIVFRLSDTSPPGNQINRFYLVLIFNRFTQTYFHKLITKFFLIFLRIEYTVIHMGYKRFVLRHSTVPIRPSSLYRTTLQQFTKPLKLFHRVVLRNVIDIYFDRLIP